MPDELSAFPFGLKGGPSMLGACERFARPHTVLIGEADNDPAHHQLNVEPEPASQGPHRVARAQQFWQRAQAASAAAGCKLSWSLVSVPNTAHEFDKMAAAAVAHWQLRGP